MAFWQRAEPHPGEETSPAGAARPVTGQACRSLARALARVLKDDLKPEVLALGPLCGESAVYLAGRGARVHVDEVEPPPPRPPRNPGMEPEEPVPFRIDQPDGKFQLVFPGELIDFVPPDRLLDFGSELNRVLESQGFVVLFSHSRPEAAAEPAARYRILADDMVAREEGAGPSWKRYVHPNREIERALPGMSIQSIHLQRNQLREILVVKK